MTVDPSRSPSPGSDRTPEGLPLTDPSPAGGGVPDLLQHLGFRLSGTFYRLRWPAGSYDWMAHLREHGSGEMTYKLLVRCMDGFILKHLTEHGRTLWVLSRNEGVISLDQMYEVVYWLDPDSRPSDVSNRQQRRRAKRRRR
jgi:hypothetical protein